MHVAFLITAHQSYLRRAGPSPAGEEPLHALMAQSLIPLISRLGELRAAGIGARIALAISPILLEQIADPVVQKHFLLWIESQYGGFSAELERYSSDEQSHYAYLARFYQEWSEQTMRGFAGRYKRNLALALRELVQAGQIEPLAAPATMACLPLLSSEVAARVQIEQGLLAVMRHLGRPQGIWLAGCGWRAGLEPLLAAADLRYVVVAHELLPAENQALQPIWLAAGDQALRWRMAALAADPLPLLHLSFELGYRGDPLYRAGAAVGATEANGLERPQPYDPYHAFRRAHEHAAHFVALLTAEAARRPADQLLLISLDAAILGADWFEGPTWFEAVLRHCAAHHAITLTTPAEFLRRHRPQITAGLQAPPTGLPQPDHYWAALQLAEALLIETARHAGDLDDDQERALNQAARELLLAQSGDWLPLMADPAQRTVAEARWRTYLDRCRELCAMARKPALNSSDLYVLGQLEERDGPFPTLNYRIFAAG